MNNYEIQTYKWILNSQAITELIACTISLLMKFVRFLICIIDFENNIWEWQRWTCKITRILKLLKCKKSDSGLKFEFGVSHISSNCLLLGGTHSANFAPSSGQKSTSRFYYLLFAEFYFHICRELCSSCSESLWPTPSGSHHRWVNGGTKVRHSIKKMKKEARKGFWFHYLLRDFQPPPPFPTFPSDLPFRTPSESFQNALNELSRSSRPHFLLASLLPFSRYTCDFP